MVSDASHELRTPLTALRTEVDLALLGNRDASELRAALKSAGTPAQARPVWPGSPPFGSGRSRPYRGVPVTGKEPRPVTRAHRRP